MSKSILSTVEEALEAIAKGRMVMVVDDENRENEGDFICSAQLATPENINFMAQEGRGLICVSLYPDRAQALNLQVPSGAQALHGTAFTQSVDYKIGTTSGISAADRSATCGGLASLEAKPDDFARPGHIFPLIARQKGVLERRGHTEATADLCRLAGLAPVGVLCEILNPDGTMARLPQLVEIAKKFNLPLISVEQLVHWRRCHETQIESVETVDLPTVWGEFQLTLFHSEGAANPLGLVKKTDSEVSKENETLPLVRVHSECLTGDVFKSMKCDCGDQLDQAMQNIAQEKKGGLIYLRQEGRGIGLEAKIKAYKLQQQGLDTWEANTALGLPPDARDYWEAAQILKLWGWTKIRLLTNNPSKVKALENYGIEVAQRVPLEIHSNPYNKNYLQTKRTRFEHLLTRI